MARGEAIARARTALADLTDKYGLAFHSENGLSLMKQADDLRLKRVVMSPPKTVMPCAAELKDVGLVDPCLIVPASLPIELLPNHKALAVGGQVLSLARSFYCMSPYLTEEAWRAQGFWNGQPLPLLVSIKGSYKYLVKQKSYFFKYEEFVGSDIDQLSPMEPNPKDLKLQRFYWGKRSDRRNYSGGCRLLKTDEEQRYDDGAEQVLSHPKKAFALSRLSSPVALPGPRRPQLFSGLPIRFIRSARFRFSHLPLTGLKNPTINLR